MAEIGKFNRLMVAEKVDFGVYLDGEQLGEILLPSRYVTPDCKTGDSMDVFIYFDSEDRIVATTEHPYAEVGRFAFLKAVDVNAVGAFLDWGLKKDLLVPFREQKKRMEKGHSYVVFVYIDEETELIAASSLWEKFLDHSLDALKEGQEVDLLIGDETELGFKAIVNNAYLGLLYKNEVFKRLEPGEKTKGFIKKLRADGKIDLSLHKPGYERIDELSLKILDHLEKAGGFIAVTDKSPPEIIAALFGVSKKRYKQAIGALYKRRLITLDKSGIKTCEERDIKETAPSEDTTKDLFSSLRNSLLK